MLNAAAEEPSSSLGSCLSNACSAQSYSGRNRHCTLPSVLGHFSTESKKSDLFKAGLQAMSVIGLS